MIAKIIAALTALAISLGGGIYLSERTTAEFNGFGKLQIGSWVAYPSAGSPDADPYLRASASRVGRIGLGSTEGLSFVARTDDEGEALRAECDYRLTGRTPAARAWTLRVVDESLKPVGDKDNAPISTNSEHVVRNSNGSFELLISNNIETQNWLAMAGEGQRSFVIGLYDTSVGTYSGIGELVMPSIENLGCNNG